MMRISLDSPALIAVRSWLAGPAARPARCHGRSRRRKAARLKFRGEQLEPRTMLDAGMRALLPDLVATSDTGVSSADNLTSDRTPDLSGMVRGAARQVRLVIDGQRVATLPVVNGMWNYAVPAEAALAAGKHTIAVRPVAASGRTAPLSKPLAVTIVTAPPTRATVNLGPLSDSGAKGDGKTTFATPALRGVAPRGQWVNVSIDGVFAGRVQSHAKTGVWSLTAPRLANGVHDVTAVVENRAGLRGAATNFKVTINGERTVMLDGSDGKTVELKASHLLGQGSQGFVVTQVHRGTLQKWVAAKNAWVTVPPSPPPAPARDPAWVRAADAIRKITFTDTVRWTPARGAVGTAPAFSILPIDNAGGLIAPTPEPGTVPGRIRNPQIDVKAGLGTTLTWESPTDGCGCASTRYSIELTREDGQTLVYNVASGVRAVSVVEGGRVLRAELWGATKSGAGTRRWHDAVLEQKIKNRLAYNLTSGLSALSVGEKARAQLASSPTEVDGSGSSFVLGGSHADLAYLEVSAVPDANEAAQGLPAGTPIFISSESNKLTPTQKAKLEDNPILARNLFPGTVDGLVLPDHVRAHFQAGETLRFAGNVDPKVRAGATIVVEEAQILGDNSLGPWFEKARIAVPADGGYAYDHVVPYGMTSVRARLEYRTQPVAPAMRASSVGATASTPTPVSTAIDLSSSFNAFGITTAPWQVANNQGFDRNGNYYNSDYTGSSTNDPVPGTPITYNGISFPIGPVPTDKKQVGGSKGPQNFVQAKGQTITVSVDADKSDYLYLAGAAANGNQMSQKITLTFTDGTTEKWTQSFHDWASAGPPQQGATTQANHSLLPVIAVAPSGVTLTGLQTIDGIALTAGDRVLVQSQGNAADNGVYIAQAGAWTRAKDADTSSEIAGSYTTVTSGTYAGKTFINTNTGTIDLGSSAITFVEGTPPTPAPQPFAGELLLKTEPERINQQGNLVTTPAHIFAYCYNLKGKQLASITLPNNDNVGILSAVVAKAPVIALNEGVKSAVLGTTNLTGIDLVALTISNESNIGAGGGPLTFFFADQPVKGSTTSVAISSIATAGGISRDGQSFSGGGFDGDGNAYSWEALGSSRILRGNSATFELGLPGQPDFVIASGQTVQVPQGSSYTTLNLAGAAVNGGQENQPLTLTFTDNSTAIWTQSFSDWCNPQNYANESTIATQSYRDTASGDQNQTTNHVYQYSYTIPSGKTLKSITLPTNANVRLLDIQMTPPLYTTKQVTVPMGQQTTIAYIAPDSSSQMTFYVQKEDGTCVGSTCSTYLTDWNNGSGNNKNWAANLSPSLNSQMKAGQRWTLTVQNAGEGYYGYLDSPNVPGLPGASGSTPAGAQFKLETQAEINSQPPWAVALEEDLGAVLALVGLAILTGGIGDAAVVAEAVTEEVVTEVATEETTITASVSGAIANEAGDIVATTWYENLITDSFVAEVTGAGEGGVFFGDGIDVIANVDDLDSILDGSFSEADAAFEGQVEVDVGAAEQQQIIEAEQAEARLNAALRTAMTQAGFF